MAERASIPWLSFAGKNLREDPFSGCVVVFRSRGGTAIRLLTYDGQAHICPQHQVFRLSSELRARPVCQLLFRKQTILLCCGESTNQSKDKFEETFLRRGRSFGLCTSLAGEERGVVIWFELVRINDYALVRSA